MLVELHTHTNFSRQRKVPIEGINTPEEMIRQANKLGLGAIAITDHDEIKGALEAKKYAKKYDVVVIPGEEVTTTSGHMLCLGIEELLKPGLSVEESIDLVHQQGGIAIGDHPFDIKNDGIGALAKLTDAVEVFNAINVDRFSNSRAKRFAIAHRKPQVAGSDAHWTEMVGFGINEINADNVDNILKAIKKGHTEVIGNPMPANLLMRWAVLRLKLSYPFVLNYIENNYSQPKQVVTRNLLKMVNTSPGSIDQLFKAMAYMSLGSAFLYSAAKNAGR